MDPVRRVRPLASKYSLDSIAKSQGFVSKKPPKRVRSRASKLDLLQQDTLTSFPKWNSVGSTAEAESIMIVEDYIPESSEYGGEVRHGVDDVSSSATIDSLSSSSIALRYKSDHRTCCNCGFSLQIDRIVREYDTFLCQACAENTPIYASTVVKIEGSGGEPYYVLIHKQWYSTLRHKLRWRWRIKGLLG